jgi:hypothetical protein
VVRVGTRGEISDEFTLVVSGCEFSQSIGDAVGDDAFVRGFLDVTLERRAHLHERVRRFFLVRFDGEDER